MKTTTHFPVQGNKYLTTKILTTLVLILVGATLPCTIVQASVKGACSDCHTMHNSQDGSAVVTSGTGTTLLIDNCVGCHSSATNQTIVNGIPIVWNAVPPNNPLAGGNFYWIAQGGGSAADDVFGHNVWGISAPDHNILPSAGAPGNGGFTCGTSCHASLATDPALNPDVGGGSRGGCQGCHYEVAHHDDSKPWFRFLKGHITTGAYVEGIEAPTWEQNAITDSTDRNVYRGTDTTYTWGAGLNATKTASAFCQGCHIDFHQKMGVSNPWIRHPNDILLPESSEYGAYDPITDYSNEAPVAYLDPAVPARAEAVVTCLSCHRAHGSDQPDMLRWDYTNMAAGTGCYTCHTTKY
ncbi:MAG: hypothetical protein KKD73_05620 [Proteobacteria bacterium]|nr:hypothetical protein [Pseudomonadota bacterium]MBU1639826.1 hypothetical protein [Pseudomonadota bacterium]